MTMMIISVATGIGLQQKIREKVSGFNGHIIISNYDDNQSEGSVSPISIKQNFYPKFTSVEGIAHVQGVAAKAGIIRTEESFEGIIMKGVGSDYKWDNITEYIVAGKRPSVQGGLTPDVLISKFLADRLRLQVGDRFNTFFMKDGAAGLPNLRVFTVSGIYDSGIREFDATYIIGDIRHIRKMNKWLPEQVGAFEVFIDDFSDLEQKASEVYEETGSTLDTRSIQEKYAYIFDWLKLFDFNIWVILGIMILVASINMVVALLVLILERTRMIGILKSLGAENAMIRKIFLYQAFYLIMRGLLWGNAIGLTVIVVQKVFKVIKLSPENYYVTEAPVDINLVYILLLNIGTVAICLAVLLFPSYLITKISPSRAIRFD